ncbi:hypothetical protein ACT3SP_12285 [Brachybacterium sp. AOP43-C2-M15]
MLVAVLGRVGDFRTVLGVSDVFDVFFFDFFGFFGFVFFDMHAG